MTLVEEALSQTVAERAEQLDLEILNSYTASLRDLLLRWLDEHAEDKVARVLWLVVRVKHIRWVFEELGLLG